VLVSGPAETDFLINSKPLSVSNVSKVRDREDALASTPEACATLLQLPEPAQRDRSLRIISFVPAVERADFYPLKASAFD
jgi:hypothetical protein